MNTYKIPEQALVELVKRLTDEALVFLVNQHVDISFEEAERKWFKEHKESMFDSNFIPKQYVKK